jgi:replicative DNA helicase
MKITAQNAAAVGEAHRTFTTEPSLVPGFEDARATHMRDAADPMMARFKLASKYPGAIHQATGLKALDDVVPFAPGRLIVVAGRQGAGKSALSLQIARHISVTGPVLYLLTEMSREEVVSRAVANVGQVDGFQLDRGADEETLAAAAKGLKWLADNSDLTVVEVGGLHVAKVLNGIEEWVAANPSAKCVVVDNLWGLAQTLNLGSSSSGTSVIIGKLAAQLAQLSTKLAIPILLVHHVNREGAGQGGTPDVSWLGGSDHIGNWASSVIIIRERPPLLVGEPGGVTPEPGSRPTDTHSLFVVKNRGGRTSCRIDLGFVGSQSRFVSGKEPEPFEVPAGDSARDVAYRAAFKALPEW